MAVGTLSILVDRNYELPANKTDLNKAKLHTETLMHTYTETESARMAQVRESQQEREIRGPNRKFTHICRAHIDTGTHRTHVYTHAHTHTQIPAIGSTETQKTSRDVDSSLEVDELGTSTSEAT